MRHYRPHYIDIYRLFSAFAMLAFLLLTATATLGFAGNKLFWAATELGVSTGNDKYIETTHKNAPANHSRPIWSNFGCLG